MHCVVHSRVNAVGVDLVPILWRWWRRRRRQRRRARRYTLDLMCSIHTTHTDDNRYTYCTSSIVHVNTHIRTYEHDLLSGGSWLALKSRHRRRRPSPSHFDRIKVLSLARSVRSACAPCPRNRCHATVERIVHITYRCGFVGKVQRGSHVRYVYACTHISIYWER